MSYYELLGLVREPFSNSPDPDMFYRSKGHMECLQQMEIAVRLRRGLNVVIGDVGTGKTTLCRQLIRTLGLEDNIETYLLLDPYFKDPVAFLKVINRVFGVPEEDISDDYARLKDNLKNFLRRRGEEEGKIVALIVDEGQKITGECLELLRELLNYENDKHKLLQIVLFAQKEFAPMLKARPNLMDRVNFRFTLEPLDFSETRRMIETRLSLSAKDARAPELFSRWAVYAVHRRSRGYPRKIVQLCHKTLLTMVARDKRKASIRIVRDASRGLDAPRASMRRRMALAGALLWLAMPVAALYLMSQSELPSLWDETVAEEAPAVSAVAETQGAFPQRAVPTPPSGELRETALPETAATGTVPPQPAARIAREETVPAAANPADLRVNLPAMPAEPAAPQAPADAFEEDVIEIVAEAPAIPETPAAVEYAAEKKQSAVDEDMAALSAKTPPGLLGQIRMRSGWIVSKRAAGVYGSAGRHILRLLAGANPEIGDMDKIQPGDVLNFPAIIASPLPEGAVLVRAGRVDSLHTGFASIFQAEDDWPPLTLFAHFNPEDGLVFDIIVDKVFMDKKGAGEVLAQLPPELAQQASLLDSFKPETVFYTELDRPAPEGFTPGEGGKAVAQNTM